MQLGTREANPVTIARVTVEDQDTGETADEDISEDVDGHNVPRRIRIRYVAIHSSKAASYVLRIFTRTSRVNCSPWLTDFEAESTTTVVAAPT